MKFERWFDKDQKKFNESFQIFIAKQRQLNLDPVSELNQLVQKYLPKETEYIDPIEAIINSKDCKYNVKDNNKNESVLINEVSGLRRPLIKTVINHLMKMNIYNGQIKK